MMQLARWDGLGQVKGTLCSGGWGGDGGPETPQRCSPDGHPEPAEPESRGVSEVGSLKIFCGDLNMAVV